MCWNFLKILIYMIKQIAVAFFLLVWKVAIFPTAQYQYRRIITLNTSRSSRDSITSPVQVKKESGAHVQTMATNGCRSTLGGKQL